MRRRCRAACVALLLIHLALAQGSATAEDGPWTADQLVSKFAASQGDERSDAGIQSALFDLEMARLSNSPRVTLQQQAGWWPGTTPNATLSVAFTVPIASPGREAQLELARLRLDLARFEESQRAASEIVELRRLLRMLAHVHEVLSVLDEAKLHLQSAEDTRAARSIGSLELERATARMQGEQEILLRQLLASFPVAEGEMDRLDPASLGKPTIKAPQITMFEDGCRLEGSIRRDALLYEEALLTAASQEAREATSLDFSARGNVAYGQGGIHSDPFTFGAGLGLNVRLPVTWADSSVSFDVDASGISQSATFRFPAQPALPASEAKDAQARFERASLEAEITARQAWLAWQDAQRGLEIRQMEAANASAQFAVSPSALQAAVQAQINLLSAELQVDLALLNLASICSL